MKQQQIFKTTVGVLGGAAAGGLFGAITGAMGGALQFGIPIGFLIGCISALTGNGFSGFLGALIGTTFLSAVAFGLICAVFYAFGGAAAGSSWGQDDK